MLPSFLDACLLSLGIFCGVAFALTLVILWVGLAGPLQEWLCEVTLDRWARRRAGSLEHTKPPEAGASRSVLISDIHLDTWNYGAGEHRSFAGFVQWIRDDQGVTDLYINGDIMDMPPHPLNQKDVHTLHDDHLAGNKPAPGQPFDEWQQARYPDLAWGPLGVLQAQFDAAFVALSSLVQRDPSWPELRVTYLTGNHDIGIGGLRFIRPELPWSAFRIAWNPSVVLHLRNDRWVYLEHGHRHDPFLWIYLRYAVVELLRAPGTAKLAQRSGKAGMYAPPKETPGTAAKVAALMAKEGMPAYPGLSEIQPEPGERFFVRVARYRFRQAARKTFRLLHKRVSKNVRVVSFGHTHIPDRYEFPGGRLYVNSGDWAGNSPHQSYVLIHEDGVVSGPHQWSPNA